MPQNSKYSHPWLSLCRVRGGFFLADSRCHLLKGGLSIAQTCIIRHKNMFSGHQYLGIEYSSG